MKEEEPPLKTAEEAEPEASLRLEEWLDYKLLKERTVVLAGDVELAQMKATTKLLLYLGAQNKDPIRVILNSPGGEVYVGLLLFVTLKELVRRKIEVIVEVRGLAASTGAIILQAGSKRVASRYSRFLIHEVSSISWGKASEQEEQVKELLKVNDMLAGILAERTGKSMEEIEKIWKKTDYWMSAQEALKFGLVDEVVD